MPYITQKDRTVIDPAIDQLAEQIVFACGKYPYDDTFVGLLNYTCTRLVLSVVRRLFGSVRYWIIAAVTGILYNIADEFYRRIAVPYENKKIAENGDVDLYAEFAAQIGEKK